MQQLDYVFIYFLAVFGVYSMFRSWWKYFRVNRKTPDNLLEVYCDVELKKRLRRKK